MEVQTNDKFCHLITRQPRLDLPSSVPKHTACTGTIHNYHGAKSEVKTVCNMVHLTMQTDEHEGRWELKHYLRWLWGRHSNQYRS